MVAKFIKKEGVEKVVIGNVVIMFLLYVNDVMLFAKNLGDVQKLIRTLSIGRFMHAY